MAPAKADSVAKSLWESDALAWDRYWVPIFSLFAKQLALVSSPSPDDVILDVGTGSGLAVRELRKTTPSVGFIIGIDSSDEMIRLAHRRASAGLKNVKFLKMPAEELRFPNDFFDVVVSNCGINIAHFSQCIKEISRVLRPSGVLAFNDWNLIDVKPHRIFGEILGRHRTATPSPQLARERAALALDESLDAKAQLHILLEAGFKRASLVKRRHQVRLNSIEDYMRLRLCRSMIRREISEMTSSNRRMFLRDLRPALKQFLHDDAFIFNWPVFYIRANKPR
jgi:ubiquinone/menaquinone biosynthesis C-methylase UbiE